MMKLVVKILAFGIILLVLNQLYKRTLFIDFVDDHADQYLQVDKIKNCDIIYISASSNFPPEHIEENDPRKISQFVADYFPELQFEAINKPASHAGVYRQLLPLFPEESEAKTFIITMNLRSFGPSWINSDLETALNESNIFYNDRPALINRFLVSLNAYENNSSSERNAVVQEHWSKDPLPYDEPKNTVNNWCAIDKWGDWKNPKRQLADQFIKQYAFVIDEENQRVKDFDEICRIANKRGFKVIYNLLAENIETADSLVGENLTSLIKQNSEWLVNRYTSKGFIVVNNLEVLRASNYTDKDFPTEHYNEKGRKTIAKNIANTLKSIEL